MTFEVVQVPKCQVWFITLLFIYVCLLFYAIGGFICYIFVFLLSRRARKHRLERDVYYDNIFFTILRNSALLGKKSSYWETKRLLSMP